MKFTALKLFCKEYIQVQKHAFTDCSLNKNSSSYGLIWREIMLLTLSRIIICYSKWTASLNLGNFSFCRTDPYSEDNHSNNFHTKTEALVHFWVNFFFKSEMSRKMYFLTIRVLLIFYEAVILIKEQSLFVLT